MTETVVQFRQPKDIDGRPIYTEVFFLRIAQIAPPHPPCFESQADWCEWLALAGSSGDRRLRPLLSNRFNTAIDFCTDCDGAYHRRMQAEGRCSPGWVAHARHASEAVPA